MPIPGSRTPNHIDENPEAARISLHADALAEIDRLVGAGRGDSPVAAGGRPHLEVSDPGEAEHSRRDRQPRRWVAGESGSPERARLSTPYRHGRGAKYCSPPSPSPRPGLVRLRRPAPPDIGRACFLGSDGVREKRRGQTLIPRSIYCRGHALTLTAHELLDPLLYPIGTLFGIPTGGSGNQEESGAEAPSADVIPLRILAKYGHSCNERLQLVTPYALGER